ncbi:protein rhomboid-like [Paramacrobiotus metropolitanus]|uniref:protein rhomboid-like n=1 Tax=Paramacrobiotus metropolitanus TaxID=2943436 RepID=UPI0024460D22|nr:protein rhomboid-like [Paramacrobiotus metropolitanus]
MERSLYKFLLWRKQSGDDIHMSDDNTDDEFGFIKPTIEHNKHTIVQKVVRKAVKEVLVEDGLSGYYADNYRCRPPPVFLIAVSITELAVFIYYGIVMGSVSTIGPVPIDSPFIYRPDRRLEIWRFITYSFLHAGWFHLVFNIIIQIFVGLPLEMVHGNFRIGIIYLSGVLAGSLGTSVFDPDVYLVGASGGVYALLSAHLANILLNRTQMELPLLRMIGVLLVASCVLGVAIWDRYAAEPTPMPISYIAHIMGTLSGICMGLIVLKHFDQKLSWSIAWWIAVFVYLAFVVFTVLWNVCIIESNNGGLPYRA